MIESTNQNTFELLVDKKYREGIHAVKTLLCGKSLDLE